MATPLDLGLLKHFSAIFPFILVFAVSYVILNKVEIFGGEKNKQINAIIALALAVMTLFSPNAIALITFIAPYFLVFMFFIIMLLLVYQFLGVKEKHLERYMQYEFGNIHYWILGVALVIIIMGLSSVFGPSISGDVPADEVVTIEGQPVQGEALQQRVVDIIYHPRVLGLLLLLLIATFTINSITRPVYDINKEKSEFRKFVHEK